MGVGERRDEQGAPVREHAVHDAPWTSVHPAEGPQGRVDAEGTTGKAERRNPRPDVRRRNSHALNPTRSTADDPDNRKRKPRYLASMAPHRPHRATGPTSFRANTQLCPTSQQNGRRRTTTAAGSQKRDCPGRRTTP